MHRFAFVVPFVIACGTEPVADFELATETDSDIAGGKADSSWQVASTMHVGQRAFDFADVGGRKVFPVWLDAGIAVDVVATANDGGSVRVAVLGPLRNGKRDVIAAAGYSTPRANIEMTVDAPDRGEYLVVVGSHNLASATSFQLATYCPDCTGSETDILAAPKAGALVGEDRLVSMQLGDVLSTRDFDIEVDLYASPPGLPWIATKVATSVASGNQVNVIVPDSVATADDLTLVVREAGGRVLDTGVRTRFAPVLAPIVRTDALLYGDLVSVQASGIAGYFEGVLSMSMRSETRGIVIADTDIHIDLPGHVGNGFNAFDAAFNPELTDESGVLNPNLPTNGELLSIGMIDGNGGYRRMACFEYCNDLSGMETCTGGPRTCP
jgi:hypothetical protein